MELAITLRVTASKPIPWYIEKGRVPYREYDLFRYTLRNSNGELPLTHFHRVLRGQDAPDDPSDLGGSSLLTSLPPGQAITITADLSKLYDIAVPGRYTFTAERTDGTKENRISVRSNTVTVDVEPE
jgi:hypothetical protein